MDRNAGAGRSAEVLALRGLSAGYGGRPIIRDIDLTISRGDILGLLGANGSGKSTLVKAVTGQLPLLGGSVSIDGVDLVKAPRKAKAAFGLAIDATDLPAPLTGLQYLELVGSIRGCAADDWPCGDVVARLGLGGWLNRPIGEYSLGTRGKISIAAALLGGPPLLIFDESLNGLDPVVAWEAKRIIRELAATGRHAILMSTHVVEAVPALCNRAVFLSEGRFVDSWDNAALMEAGRAAGAFELIVMEALRRHALEAVAA